MSNEYSFKASDGCHYENGKEYLYIGILGGCGCGSSDELAEDAYKVLEHFTKDFDERTLNIYEEKHLELLANMMDNEGLLDHGSSIGGGWLTDKGERIYKEIKTSL